MLNDMESIEEVFNTKCVRRLNAMTGIGDQNIRKIYKKKISMSERVDQCA